jgi:hypothetical protein
MTDDVKVDGVAIQPTTAQQHEGANLLMELAIMLPQLRQIQELEALARKGNAGPGLGLVLQMNVAHLQDTPGLPKVLLPMRISLQVLTMCRLLRGTRLPIQLRTSL